VAGRSGFSTVDGMVAITLFALAALGAGGAMARSARALGEANRETAAARATAEIVERLRTTLRAAGDRCGAVVSGSTLTAAAAVSWRSTPAMAGIDLRVIATRPGLRQPRSDTLWLFLPCR